MVVRPSSPVRPNTARVPVWGGKSTSSLGRPDRQTNDCWVTLKADRLLPPYDHILVARLTNRVWIQDDDRVICPSAWHGSLRVAIRLRSGIRIDNPTPGPSSSAVNNFPGKLR